MNRDELAAEIKKLLQEELKYYSKSMTDKIPEQHKAQAVEIKNELTDLVKEHPLAALGFGIAAGFFIGRLLYKRRSQ